MRQTITILSALLLILVSCTEEGKDNITYPEYYRNYNSINTLVSNDQLDQAILQFDSISSRIPHIPSNDLFWMAQNCANANKCDLAAKYLKLAIENGQVYGKGLGAYKTIDNCQEGINQVLLQEDEIHKQHFNFQYKATIDSMFRLEQEARQSDDYELVQTMDSLHMIKILELIEDHGYPSEKIIGHQTAFRAFMIFLHMDQDIGNEILKPILDKAYNDGYLWPRGLAWIVDRRRYWGPDEIEPYYYHMKTKKFEKFNLQELQEVNRRRDSIGLEPN